MKHMVGFRNIAVHSYEKLEQPILEAIVPSQPMISQLTHPLP